MNCPKCGAKPFVVAGQLLNWLCGSRPEDGGIRQSPPCETICGLQKELAAAECLIGESQRGAEQVNAELSQLRELESQHYAEIEELRRLNSSLNLQLALRKRESPGEPK